MKKINLTLFLLFAFNILNAQDCSSYFKFSKGMKVEMTSFDKKDKPAAILKYEVLDYKPVNGGFSLVFSNETYDSKGKLLGKGESFGKCNNGDYITDIRNISSDMIPKSADIKMNIDGDKMVYPARMKVGDKLPDASIKISSSLSTGMTLMNITANITDRKVEANESIETPVGKFNCLKITYTLNTKFMGNRTMICHEYLADGIGVIKQEQFDEKGKKQSSLILTKLEK